MVGAAVLGFLAALLLVARTLTPEELCAGATAALVVIDTGAVLLDHLESWLAQAESLIAGGGGDEAAAREGLGSLLDMAEDVVGKVEAVLTAPLKALIDTAQAVVEAVQDAMNAARDVVSIAQTAGCAL